ncbi:MAG: fibronectin type III domain-containing protein [Fimbriimonadaceae bacterium]
MKPLLPSAIAIISLASISLVAIHQSQTAIEPSRILLTWNGDPATTAAITWRTDKPSAQTIQFAVASADPRFPKDAQTLTSTEQQVALTAGGTAYYHTATLKSLKPNTKYSYRVGEGNTWSEWFDFKTASNEPKPFTFIYFGDAQNDVKSMWSRVIRQAQKDAPYADFMLHAGDLINVPDADNEWRDWFYAGGWLHSTIPSVATPGNHEYKSGKITPLWNPQFNYPHNGVAGLEDSNYYIDYQGTRIISLNTMEKQEEQAQWLDKTLAKTKANWTILTFHYPMYSTAKGRDNKALRDIWLPIILKHKVNLVLQGHDHSYGRMNLAHDTKVSTEAHSHDEFTEILPDDEFPINSLNASQPGEPIWDTPTNLTTGMVARADSTYFVVSVSGPKMYNLGEDAQTRMTKTGEYKQLYQVIDVTPKKISYKAFLATGVLYDSFEINK